MSHMDLLFIQSPPLTRPNYTYAFISASNSLCILVSIMAFFISISVCFPTLFTAEVQEKVYRTLRHHVVVPPPNLSSLPRSLSSIEAGASTASTMASPRMTGLIGMK